MQVFIAFEIKAVLANNIILQISSTHSDVCTDSSNVCTAGPFMHNFKDYTYSVLLNLIYYHYIVILRIDSGFMLIS